MTVHIADSAVQAAEALRELKGILGDHILLDQEVRDHYRSDFGRTVNRLPGAVARCASAEEVAEVIRFCRERKIPVAARGQAHTQSGQTTTEGGLVLDTSVMNTIHEIDEAAETATVGCGVVWRDLVSATLEKGLIPRVLTNNLGVQISGTLSMAGLGVASFRYGTQADNALSSGGHRHRRDRHLLARAEPRPLRRRALRPRPVRRHHARQGPAAEGEERGAQVLPPLRRPGDGDGRCEGRDEPGEPHLLVAGGLVYPLPPGDQEDRRGDGARRGDADLRRLVLPASPDRRVRSRPGAGRSGGPRRAHPLPARPHRGLLPVRVRQPDGPGLRALAAQRLLGDGPPLDRDDPPLGDRPRVHRGGARPAPLPRRWDRAATSSSGRPTPRPRTSPSSCTRAATT